MNTYRYTFVSTCPNNKESIIYYLEIRKNERVMVEHIKTACALHTSGYQEDIASDLHSMLGGRLSLRAMHHGVEIETVIEQPANAASPGPDPSNNPRRPW